MTEPQVVRMQNPEALKVPEVKTLFERAFSAADILPDFDDVEEEVANAVLDPRFGLFVGVEEAEFRGVLAIMLPTCKMDQMPQILHFYAGRPDRRGASAPLRHAMMKAGVDFMVENGYTAYRAVCPYVAPRKIAAWQRLFRKGGKSREMGRVMEFAVGS